MPLAPLNPQTHKEQNIADTFTYNGSLYPMQLIYARRMWPILIETYSSLILDNSPAHSKC